MKIIFKIFCFMIMCHVVINAIPGTFSPENKYPINNTFVGSTVRNITGDFNGDRITDIGFYYSSSSLRIMYGSNSGFHTPNVLSLSTNLLNNNDYFSGDFNGDGYDDILVYANQKFWVSLSGLQANGVFYFTPLQNWTPLTTLNTDYIVNSSFYIGDFDGDGIDEILCKLTDNNNVTAWSPVKFSNTSNKFSKKIFGATYSTIKSILEQSNPKWVGDFNGDGKDDFIVYNNGAWNVSLSTTGVIFNFTSATDWLYGHQVTIDDVVLIGDFNGDGKSDICYHKDSLDGNTDVWCVMVNDTTGSPGFNWEYQWASGAGTNNGVYAGDFDGDGLCDKATYIYTSNSFYRGWWVALSVNQYPREVGVHYEPTILWEDYINDKNKYTYPVMGATTSTPVALPGAWSRTTAGLVATIQDMKWCGIDFVIHDLSNGIQQDDPAINRTDNGMQQFDGAAVQGLVEFVQALGSSETAPNNIKFAVMLGAEFWDVEEFDWYKLNSEANDNLSFGETQKARQQSIISKFNSSGGWTPWTLSSSLFSHARYYTHNNRPLLEAYIGHGQSQPLNNTSDKHFSTNPYSYVPKYIPKKLANITLRYLPNNERSYTTAGNYRNSIPGMKEQGYWGWGSGRNWKEGDSLEVNYRLPESKEMMTVMPGVTYYNAVDGNGNKYILTNIQRDHVGSSDDQYQLDRGAYYKKSWCDVLEVMPHKVTITSWNAYTEETAIECVRSRRTNYEAWGDLYLRLTKHYAYMFKNGMFYPDSTNYLRIKDSLDGAILPDYYIHEANTNTFRKMNTPPSSTSRRYSLLVPARWLKKHYSEGVPFNKHSSAMDFDYVLLQNYPNPFNPSTEINFQMPENGNVSLKIFDVLGREIETLVNEYKTAGKYTYSFNGSKFASGVYFYKLQVNNFVSVKKMMILK